MKPERWRQIDGLLQAALQMCAGERAAFLDNACAGDSALRSEVESLIKSHEKEDSFLASPLFDHGMAVLARRGQGKLSVGRVIKSYRVLALLGAGGMAEVYLARDTKLDRNVALKILPDKILYDEPGMRRFHQEARATSALNHPNIITIYEIGQEDDTHFIAMEYVEGATLRQRLALAPVMIEEALDVAMQVTSAIIAAHDAGIVHRDIKPENIMLRADGYVKVLDFGLAKLTRTQSRAADNGVATILSTNPGVVMGTINYMSPEQVRGLEVDARTDVWSLGVVLYEMIAGKGPFKEETTSDVIVSILEREPPKLTECAKAVPAELNRIVSKALAKDREERYQTARDMLIELRELKQQLDAQAQRRSLAGSKSRRERSRAGHASGRTRSYERALLPALAVVFIIASILLIYYKWFPNAFFKSEAGPFQPGKITALTTTGRLTRAAISPDGKYIAYVNDDSGQQSLWVRQVTAPTHRQIIPSAGVQYRGITFSPDSTDIYYVVDEGNNDLLTLYKIALLGGDPRKIMSSVDSPIAFSPDGAQFAFVRSNGQGRESSLVTANADGSGERVVAVRKLPQSFVESGPAWSPDGKMIATPADDVSDTGVAYMSVVGVRVADGVEVPVSAQKWRWVGQVAWPGDGSGIIAPVAGGESTLGQLVQISSKGDARAITNDLNSYLSVSITADSNALVAVQRERLSSIWATREGDFSHAEQMTASFGKYHYSISWTPDGRIVYSSAESGNWDIWIMNADGTGQKQLTLDAGIDHSPTVSTEGLYIVFVSSRAGSLNLWRMEIDGRNVQQLTNGGGEYTPQCTSDGWVMYTSWDTGQPRLWKVPINGGASVQVTKADMKDAAVSPDAQSIVCQYLGDPRSGWKVAVFPLKGNQDTPAMTLNVPATSWQVVRWMPDGRAVTYLDTQNDVYNVWSRQVSTGATKRLTGFNSDRIFSYDLSRDGKRLACVRGALLANAVHISRSQTK